ncbi:hypothetical protein CLOLEP_02800 [[Clostridium] leptum DSM 753]|uniref:Uncharacterized protein n=1 Tax=[Clostridium] leptum DSM 753 TaxID=428125 RepID=A7VW36_9FIRM|nr:hypothetical protein CLOLEP_02800 [[Clostridium] leptum DSM 753]
MLNRPGYPLESMRRISEGSLPLEKFLIWTAAGGKKSFSRIR